MWEKGERGINTIIKDQKNDHNDESCAGEREVKLDNFAWRSLGGDRGDRLWR